MPIHTYNLVLILPSTQWSWMYFRFSHSVVLLRTRALKHQVTASYLRLGNSKCWRAKCGKWGTSIIQISPKFLNYFTSRSLVKGIGFALGIFRRIFIQFLDSFLSTLLSRNSSLQRVPESSHPADIFLFSKTATGSSQLKHPGSCPKRDSIFCHVTSIIMSQNSVI